MVKKVYETHDNGGRPFRVEIDGRKVTVWKNIDGDGEFRHLKDFTVDEVFVGKKSPKGGYDGLKPKEAEGNSILLRIGSKYVFLGHEIYEFAPIPGDTIDVYYSDIGNSDVPYPYAVGKRYIYILLEKVAVPLEFFTPKKGIYDQYYEASTFLPMCLKGYDPKDICSDKEMARARIQELKETLKKLKTKSIQKRLG
jgi:hypothetical protein